MGQFLAPDFSKGDPNTLAGYRAAHGRPPAFEAADGSSYSVEIMCDELGEGDRGFAAYLLFVKWREHDPVAVAHVETDYLVFAPSQDLAVSRLGGWSLQDARGVLDGLTRPRAGENGAHG